MAIIKQYHADTNTTYVYESISYWDSDKQQSRSKRTLIGKIDPDTGEIIPTGKRGRKPSNRQHTDTDVTKLSNLCSKQQTQLREKDLQIHQLQMAIADLENRNKALVKGLSDIQSALTGVSITCNNLLN